MHSVDGGCCFPIYFRACSRNATGNGVHRVRQRSDVDLVEKSACIESRQHLGHVVEGRDCERCKGRVHQVSNATCGTTMMFRPASTEALKDAEDAAVTRFSTTRPVASELSRKILTCAFELVVACIRLAVQFHEGLERNGSSCTARLKPHEQSQPANQQQTCLAQR